MALSIQASGIPREEVFIASKVWSTHYGYEEVKRSLKTSLKELRTDYIGKKITFVLILSAALS